MVKHMVASNIRPVIQTLLKLFFLSVSFNHMALINPYDCFILNAVSRLRISMSFLSEWIHR